MAKVTTAGLLRSAEEAIATGRLSVEEVNRRIAKTTGGRFQSVADLKNATAAPTPDPTEIVQKEEPQADKSNVSFMQGAKDVATGIGQQFFGLGDEAYGLLQGIQASAPGGETFKEAYGRGRGESLERQKELSADPNAAYRLGQTGGFVGSMALPYAGIGKAVRGARALRGGASAAKIPQRLRPTVRGFGSRTGRSALRGSASGAASAGLYGAGSADTGERLEEGGKSALIGGLLGGAIGTAIPAVSAIKRTPGRAGERVNRLITEGMEGRRTGLMSGMRELTTGTADPKALQKGIAAARKEGISPSGQFEKVMKDTLDEMDSKVTPAFDEFEKLAKAKFKVDVTPGKAGQAAIPEVPAIPGKTARILINGRFKSGPRLPGTPKIAGVKAVKEIEEVRNLRIGDTVLKEAKETMKDFEFKDFQRTGELNGKQVLELHGALRAARSANPTAKMRYDGALDELERLMEKNSVPAVRKALKKFKTARLFREAFEDSKWTPKGASQTKIDKRIAELQNNVDDMFPKESEQFRKLMKNQVEEATVQGYMADIQRTLGQTDEAASALKNLFGGDATRDSLSRLWNRAGNQMPFDDFMTQIMKESDANKIYNMVNLRLLAPIGWMGGGAMGYARFMS